MKNILFIGDLCLDQFGNVHVWFESVAKWKFNLLVRPLFRYITSIHDEKIIDFQIENTIQTIIKIKSPPHNHLTMR